MLGGKDMANCPKCGEHLRLRDWRQHCPHCGANIVVYDLQERLMQQADSAEVEHYHFQKKVDRLKGSFIGSPLAIARIFTSLLPAGPLFLPIIDATFRAPFTEATEKVTFMTIYNNTGELGNIFKLFSGTAGDKFFAISAILFVLSVLCTLVHFVLNSLACSPKGKIRNGIIDAIILVTSVASLGLIFANDGSGSVAAEAGLGGYLYVAAQLINVFIDYLCFRKGIEIKHAQCYVGGIPIEEYFEMLERGATHDEIRAEQYARLQAIQDAKEAELKAAEEKAKADSAQAAEKEGENNNG